VDQPGDDEAAGGVDRLAAFVGAEPRHHAVGDRDVDVEPLAGEHRQHAAAAHDEIGGLVAAGDGEPTREGCVHCRRTVPFATVDVLTPRTLDDALALKAEHRDAWPIQGGTDVLVALNFDRARPAVMLNLNEVAELRGYERADGELRLGAGLTYTELEHGPLRDELRALSEAARTVGSPQIRNRGTIGGNLGTASPAGDAIPPLLVERAEVE